MSSARAFVIVLILIAVVMGTSQDSSRLSPPLRRGHWLILRADLHTHTRLSDGLVSPFDIPKIAMRHGLDVVAVTEHNLLFPSRWAAWWSAHLGGPLVLTGEEITRKDCHVLALGLTRAVDPMLPLREVIAAVHRQGGVAIAAHPARRFWPVFDKVIDVLDGVEVLHPSIYLPRRKSFNWADMLTYYQRIRSRRPLVSAIGTSDYHFFKMLGIGRTYIFVKQRTQEEVLHALRTGKTAVVLPDGHALGHPRLTQLAQWAHAQDLSPEDYSARGFMDAVGRVLGFAGLALLLFMRRR